jgi:DNA replication licensing factor MCM2
VNDERTLIPQDLLRKYIVHARGIAPSLTRLDQDKVTRLYADLRKEAEVSNGVPVAVRHIESIVRMTEASARMRLSSAVSDADLNLAIRVMLESFIAAQKHAVTRALRRQFSRYLDAATDFPQLVLFKLRELLREKQALAFARSTAVEFQGLGRVEIALRELEERCARHGIGRDGLLAILAGPEFAADGFEYDGERRVVVRENL